MNAFTMVTLLTAAAMVGLPVAMVALLRRSRADNRAWADAIAGHVAATGEHPTVAAWRAGHLRTPQPSEPDPIPPEPSPVPAGPTTVTVTVTDAEPAELPGGAR